MFKRSVFAAVLLMSAALPASAQDIATRIFQMEERIRQLTGQVEELNFTVQQLQRQLGQKGQGQSGELEQAPAAQSTSKKLVLPPQTNDLAAAGNDSGIEVIEEGAGQQPKLQSPQIIGSGFNDGSQDFTAGGNASAQTGDGNFQGQVLVAPGQGNAAADGSAASTDQDGIETVSLQPEDSPDAMYKNANEALLRRQFGEAEAGFRTFLSKYPDHSLAGSAQYWLGETFYVQGDVRQAAQNFLEAYKKYPKSRRAPDSLLKLGMSLSKMGQKEQACGAFNSVSTEFPRAVETKKRANAEYKRASC